MGHETPLNSECALLDFEAFTKRVVETLETIIQENRGKTVAVTCHGGVVNIWAAHVLGMPLKMFFKPYYTSVSRFRLILSIKKRTRISLLMGLFFT